MKSLSPSSLLNYSVGLTLIAATTGVLLLFDLTDNTTVPALLYLVPIGIVAWRFGVVASVISSIAAFLAFDYFFIKPQLTFHVAQVEDLVAIFVFLLEVVSISYWVNRAQRSLEDAREREHETTHLYGLSISLTGLHNQEDIAFTIAEHLQDTFGTDAVEVLTYIGTLRTEMSYRIPKGDAATPVVAAPPPILLI